MNYVTNYDTITLDGIELREAIYEYIRARWATDRHTNVVLRTDPSPSAEGKTKTPRRPVVEFYIDNKMWVQGCKVEVVSVTPLAEPEDPRPLKSL